VSILATPSIVMLLEFGRWPFTVKPLTEPSSVLPVFCDSAPGTSVAKLKSCRPLLAMFVSAWLSSVNERSPLVDCSSVTRLDTVTSSVTWPTSIVKEPADSLSFALTTTFVRSSVLKPCRVACSE
jgi:hypothetical protein